jgi:hypothetical protein
LVQLTRELENSQRDSVECHPGCIRDFAKAGLKDLLALLTPDAIRARAQLVKYTTEIRMIPEMAAGELHYVAEGNWSVFGGSD